MKFRAEVDGQSLLLDLQPNGKSTAYKLTGESEQGGDASVEEVAPGVYSILLNDRSFQVHLASHPQGVEVWAGLQRHIVSLADSRDKATNAKSAGTKGPVELRAQMPGKIIKLLAEEGASVTSGQGLVVVEAMKMQNEVKAPKDGILKRIHAVEGSTVGAGDLLLVVE